MRHWFTLCYCALLMGLLSGCIDSYTPDVLANPNSFLVVDGFINSRGVTTINLSRTVNLQNTGKVPVEAKATVYIEEEAGQRYPLAESKAGTYQSAALTLSTARKVRLRIKTAAQKEYASDYTTVKVTPPIDSVSWRIQEGGVQVFANAHDETAQSRYYRYEYDETWEFTSAFNTYLEFNAKEYKVQRRFDDIYHCWRTETPTTIKLVNTMKLAQDKVAEYPLTLLPSTSEKLATRYSIMVRQYALSVEEYAYWEALGKNTENIGTLFDALPTQLTGNIHSLTDASETVLGFVGVHSLVQKRIFIHYTQLPRNWRFKTGYEGCVSEIVPIPGEPGKSDPLQYFVAGAFIPLADRRDGSYLIGSADCVDCRLRGTNVKPSFWP